MHKEYSVQSELLKIVFSVYVIRITIKTFTTDQLDICILNKFNLNYVSAPVKYLPQLHSLSISTTETIYKDNNK